MTPSPSSDSDETTEMVDLIQPVEGDNSFSLSSNSDEMVDWSQPARETLETHQSQTHTYKNSCPRQSCLVVEGMSPISLQHLNHPSMTHRHGLGSAPIERRLWSGDGS